MCFRPIALKKEGQKGRIVPCGKCQKCQSRKAENWAVRINEEQKISTSAAFITFTYEQPPITKNGLPTLRKKDFQDFMKRLRRYLQYHTTTQPKTIKYFACGEYGSLTIRPHYHAIIFNLPQSILNDHNVLESTWRLGFIRLDKSELGSIRYVTKYVIKGDFETPITNDDREPQFQLMSKKLGLNYLTPQMKKFHRENLIDYITFPGGTITSLPRYYRDKIFDDEQKEILNEHAEKVRDFNFNKLFNENRNKKLEWKNDQRRKHQKEQKLKRSKL